MQSADIFRRGCRGPTVGDVLTRGGRTQKETAGTSEADGQTKSTTGRWEDGETEVDSMTAHTHTQKKHMQVSLVIGSVTGGRC